MISPAAISSEADRKAAIPAKDLETPCMDSSMPIHLFLLQWNAGRRG
jgi:hypothetical protein